MLLNYDISNDNMTKAIEMVLSKFQEDYREKLLYDTDDDSFFNWIAMSKKHGMALNHYIDSQELLRMIQFSLFKAYELHYEVEPRYIKTWDNIHEEENIIRYYLDNALVRIEACLERFYSFSDIWFEINLSKLDGKLHHPTRILNINNGEWDNSNIKEKLNTLINTNNYKFLIKEIRNDFIHNLDSRKVHIVYNDKEERIERLTPNKPMNEDILQKTLDLAIDLHKIREQISLELSKSMNKFNVKRITQADMEYWTMIDSPLF